MLVIHVLGKEIVPPDAVPSEERPLDELDDELADPAIGTGSEEMIQSGDIYSRIAKV